MLLALVMGVFMARPYLYAAQQDNYRVACALKSRRVRSVYLTDVVCVLVFGGIWAGCMFIPSKIFWGFLVSLFFCIAELALYFVTEAPEKKRPFVYTKRAVRALIATGMVCAAAATVAVALMNAHFKDAYFRYAVLFGVSLCFPLLFSFSLAFVNIFERLNNLRYERRARRVLSADRDLIKIGIGGSYGKTSVKNFLAAMLSVRFNVLATPASYNTPMGIAKTVQTLTPSHDVFIAEMGARRRGDIARLMRIVRPTHTILTGVNGQHMETFGSPAAILSEKLRMLDVRAPEGACIVNDALRDVPRVKDDPMGNIILAGGDPGSPVRFSDVAVCGNGSVFTLWLYGTRTECGTRLLGAHNIQDIAMAAGMAFRFGISPEEIRDVIAELSPVPHRMQLIEGNGIKIIDDTFNSNPDGARHAIATLALFEGRKVVVTPGMVELGSEEERENILLGRELAEVADVVMLVGGRRAARVGEGLKAAGFCGVTLEYASLAEAEKAFGEVLHVGDTLLLLNDLPDCYED